MTNDEENEKEELDETEEQVETNELAENSNEESYVYEDEEETVPASPSLVDFASSFLKDKIAKAALTNPYFWLGVGIAAIVIALIVFIFVLVVILDEGEIKNANTGNSCSYSLNGISNSGPVNLENINVELINCDAKKDNYKVLKTVNFEKYVLGVALAEIGESSPDEAIKAQIVAARNFALMRNHSMCPGNPSKCWLGYNEEANIIRLRACEADQVYWDYTEDGYRKNRGSISLYSPEVDASTSGVTKWKTKLSDERKSAVEFLASEVVGKVLVDSSDNVMSVSYNSTTSNTFISDANSGKKYDDILRHVYGSGNFSSATCNSYGNIDYKDYSLSSDGDTILNERLDSFLINKGTSLTDFNNLISSNVDEAGFGTREGVVAAAVSLIGELGDKYDVKLPYFWGGGHGVISTFADGSWGGTGCSATANGNVYSHCGLDCSGFVSWALYNGGFNLSIRNRFTSLVNEKTSLSSTQAVLAPGDILESSSHVILVIGVDEENKKYICAEASGLKEGVKFSKKDFKMTGYWGVKMDKYYNDSSKIRSH